MKKILLLDLDGTIREPITGKFIDTPNNQRVIPGADKAVEYFHNKGWLIVGISNQGGIEYGYKSLESTIEEMQVTFQLFPQIHNILFCPDMQGETCINLGRSGYFTKHSVIQKEGHIFYKEKVLTGFRKPGTAMLELAIENHTQIDCNNFLWQCRLTLENDCWFVGDRPEDEQAAENLGVDFLAADVWRNRFLPGIINARVTPKQLEFLEGIQLSR